MAPELRSSLFAALFLAAALPPAVAQSGGFTPGDLYFSTGGPQAPFADGGTGIARVDAITGQITAVVDFPSGGTSPQGIAYDAFRDRLVFGGVPFAQAPAGVWATDAQGVLELLYLDGSVNRSLLTPGTSGRVYYVVGGSVLGAPLRYLDAANVEQFLMDATGSVPFAPAWASTANAMAYDAPTNSLIVVLHGAASNLCSGTNTNFVTVHRLPLSADGARMIGPEACAQHQISSTASANSPVGIGNMLNGHVLVSIDTNSGGVAPEFLEIDPQTLGISFYAATGTTVSAKPMKNGTYSSIHDKGVCVDVSTHVLRLYGPGDVGDGVVLATSAPISPAGIVSMSWTEVRPGQCGTNVVTQYCTPKTSSTGCVPSISTSGGPSASAGTGFVIRCDSINVNKNGLLFYSTVGANGAPFQGGVLCVKPPIKRLAPQNSGGTTGCSGSYSVEFNALIASGQDPALVVGAKAWAQFWFRDPGDAFGTGLSDAVTFQICP